MKNDAATRAARRILAHIHEEWASRVDSDGGAEAVALADIIRQHTRPDLGVELAQLLLEKMGLRGNGKPWVVFDEPEPIYSRTALLGLRDLARQYLKAVGEEES